MFDRVLSVFGNSRPVLAGAISLLDNCKNVADIPTWYREGLIKREFRSKHHLIMLHCWLIHKRLISEEGGKVVQEAMFDELWEDTSNRIRNVGVNELSINKHLKDVQGYSFRYCIELDEALTKETPDEVKEEIGGALWRFNFLRDDDVEADHVMKMADYVYREHESLKDVSLAAMCEGRVAFGRPPRWDTTTTSSSSMSSVVEDGEWKRAITNEGKEYFWNSTTRESRWTLPPGVEVV
mgnify:CR=1 FL=1